MGTRVMTLIKKDNNNQNVLMKAAQKTSACPRPPAVFGRVRVSKAISKKQNMQTQKPKVPECELAVRNLNGAPQSGIPQALKSVGTKAQCTEEERLLHQHHPQRVSKADRFARTSTKPQRHVARLT